MRFRDHTVTSLWFIPSIVAATAFLVSRLSLQVDHWNAATRPPALLPGDAATIATVAATIAAAMLTFLAVVFSTTLVAVQLAGTQYSPRVVRVFVRSPVTRWTLAVFLATFIFALNTLVGVRSASSQLVPVLSISATYVLVIATLGTFVLFFHRIVRLLRVQYLFIAISRDSRDVLDEDFPDVEAYVDTERPEPDDDAAVVRFGRGAAVLQAVDVGGLVALAASAGAWIELRVAVGEHVGRDTVVARVHHDTGRAAAPQLVKHLLFDGERTTVQDPAFAIRQLVDAAIRGLSPAINDPTTAVQAIHHIVDLLMSISDRPDPSGWYIDDEGVARVRIPEDSFERLCVLGFTEVMRYGCDAPQVTRCLRAELARLAQALEPDRAAAIRRLEAQLESAVHQSMPAAFVSVASEPDPLGLG